MAQYKNIDIIPDSTVNRIHLSQGDIGRTLIFYLFENALSWSVPASSTIKCQGTKPSGFGFSVSCTYSGNAVTCVTTEEMTDEYGQIEAELLITSSDESQVFGTSNFILDIEKNPHPSSTEDGNIETAIALTARVTALESDLGDLDDLQTPVKTSIVDAINSLTVGSGLTDDIKQALLQLASKVAYIDDDGQDYYDALEDALYPPVELASITCVYTQSATVYPTTSLDSLKSDLVVTAHMTDSSTSVVSSSSYALSGTLTAGTSTITVTYGGKTTTFTVTVTAAPTLSSISAVYTQSGTVYDTDSLDSLKSDLVVTATYSDSSTATVSSSDYTLSGTLTTGTSTITVTYEGKTTTFTVTVTHAVPDTAPVITDSDKYLSNNGVPSSGTGCSCTDYYTMLGTSVTLFIPFTEGTAPRSSINVVSYMDTTKTHYWNGYSGNDNPKVLSISAAENDSNKLRFTLFTSGLASCYCYDTDSGDIYFAGSSSPYYGMSNISEASS